MNSVHYISKHYLCEWLFIDALFGIVKSTGAFSFDGMRELQKWDLVYLENNG